MTMTMDHDRVIMSVEFADLGKVRLEDSGLITDWTYFRVSEGFPETLRRMFQQSFLREPDSLIDYSFKQSNRNTVCGFSYQNYMFFCSIQRRWEGELIGKDRTGRSYNEVRITAIPITEFQNAFASCEAIYSSAFLSLTSEIDGRRIHPHPKIEKQKLKPLQLFSHGVDGDLVVDSAQAIDKFAAAYALRMWMTRGDQSNGLLWKVFTALYINVSENRSVVLIVDLDLEQYSVGLPDLVLVIEMLQFMLYVEYPERRYISFALDYFTQDPFEILFARPEDAKQLSGYLKPILLSDIDKLDRTRITHRFSNLYGNIFSILYEMFFLAKIDSYEEAKAKWLSLLPFIHSNEWAHYYLALSEGTLIADKVLHILNEAIKVGAISREMFVDVFNNPAKHTADISDPRELCKAAMQFDGSLAYHAIEHYADLVSDFDELVTFVEENGAKHEKTHINHLLLMIKTNTPKFSQR